MHPVLPERITIICRANNSLVSGVLAMLTLKAGHKNDFHILSGPTFNGITEVTRKRIVEEVTKETELFPMDYAGLGDFTGEIVVTLMDGERLAAALRAYDLYHEHIPYPPGYRDRLLRARRVVQSLGTKHLSVTTFAEGAENANIRILTEEPPSSRA
jgi:hypothetical protein